MNGTEILRDLRMDKMSIKVMHNRGITCNTFDWIQLARNRNQGQALFNKIRFWLPNDTQCNFGQVKV